MAKVRIREGPGPVRPTETSQDHNEILTVGTVCLSVLYVKNDMFIGSSRFSLQKHSPKLKKKHQLQMQGRFGRAGEL